MNQEHLDAGADPANPNRVIVRNPREPARPQREFNAQQLLNLNGPDDRYVVLIASDDHEFYIKRTHAIQSTTIEALLNAGPRANRRPGGDELQRIKFPGFASSVLKHVCQYLIYKSTFPNSRQDFPAYPVPPELAADLLVAAAFFNIWADQENPI